MKTRFLAAVLCIGMLGACGQDEETATILPFRTFAHHVLHTAKPLKLKIGYIRGKTEPSLDLGSGVTLEQFFCDNVRDILPDRECSGPKRREDLVPIEVEHKDYYDGADIRAAAEKVSSDKTNIRVVILYGQSKYYCLEEPHKRCALAQASSYGSEADIAVFFPELVTSAGYQRMASGKEYAGYIQETLAFSLATILVHEFGHTLGLVNSGLAMVMPHEDKDPDHPHHHCNNKACAMYYSGSPRTYSQWLYGEQIQGSRANLFFDKNCRDDVRAGTILPGLTFSSIDE